MKKLVFLRRCSQTFFCGLFIYILWSTTYPLKGALSSRILFKIDPLMMFLTSFSQRLLLPGFGFSILMVLLTLVLGRFFCGWVCPLGALIDMGGCLNKKRKALSDQKNVRNAKLKYIVLFVITIFSLLGIQIAWAMDPLVIFTRFISLNMIPVVTLGLDHALVFFIKTFALYGHFYDFYQGLKNSFLGIQVHYSSNSLAVFIFCLIIVGSSLFLRRLWCRALCPLGAFYAVFARFSLLRRKTEKCVECAECQKACRMGAIKDDLSYTKEECILCMDCIYGCPQGLTWFGWPGKRVKEETKEAGHRDFS